MKRNIFLYALAAMALLWSCNHKELCYHHPHTANVRVEFDWVNAPDTTPEGMSVWFYSNDDGSVRRFDFAGRQGGTVELVVGSYNVLCFNNDTEAVLFRNSDSFSSHEAYTRTGNLLESVYGNSRVEAPRAEDTEQEQVVISPDMIWSNSAINVEVTDTGLSYTCRPEAGSEQTNFVQNQEHVITLYPAELICTYTYEIRNVKNLAHATQLCGSLSSMSGAVRFADESLSRDCVTIPFAATSDGQTQITGSFLTFGHHEQNTEPHKMLLYVWMKDGSKWYYTFDVTDQIHSAPDKRHVHIIIDNLELPQPIEGEGGFDVGVDDWTTEEVDITM